MKENRFAAVAILGILALAWLALMWFFNLFSGLGWTIFSLVLAIGLLLWASEKSRTEDRESDSDSDSN